MVAGEWSSSHINMGLVIAISTNWLVSQLREELFPFHWHPGQPFWYRRHVVTFTDHADCCTCSVANVQKGDNVLDVKVIKMRSLCVVTKIATNGFRAIAVVANRRRHCQGAWRRRKQTCVRRSPLRHGQGIVGCVTFKALGSMLGKFLLCGRQQQHA